MTPDLVNNSIGDYWI